MLILFPLAVGIAACIITLIGMYIAEYVRKTRHRRQVAKAWREYAKTKANLTIVNNETNDQTQ